MTRKLFFMLFIVPNVRYFSAWLRQKDENSTGFDDEAADAADYFISKVEKWASSPDAPAPIAMPKKK